MNYEEISIKQSLSDAEFKKLANEMLDVFSEYIDNHPGMPLGDFILVVNGLKDCLMEEAVEDGLL